jgi:shikimate kinase
MTSAWSSADEALAAQCRLTAREQLLRRPVALVGFMGVGKSSVGRELARILDRRFVDTDTMVEEQSGQTIPELFRSGEPLFRKLELAAVQQALDDAPPQVIALGGGAFAQPDCAELVLQRAVVVHLHTPWGVMLRLLDTLAQDRPLIQGRPPWQVQELYLSRAASYRRAHLRVDVPRHGAVEAAEAVALLLLQPGPAASTLRTD